MEAEDLGACVELVDEDVEMEDEEEDEEDETRAATSHEALSLRLGTAGPAGMAAVAAIHSSTSGSSAKWPPNERELSPSSEVTSEASGSRPLEGRPSRRPQRDERLRIASYISDPCMRRRVAHRLMRKIRFLVDQCAVRCGQQVAVVTATPTKMTARRRPAPASAPGHILLSSASESSHSKDPPQEMFSCRVVGTEPLSTALRQHAEASMKSFSGLLVHRQQNAEKPAPASVSLFGHDYGASMPPPPPIAIDHERMALPLIQVDGVPTALEAMTQSDLRVFIPFMLKSALGRGKPFWGNPRTRPAWWPDHVLPWANIKIDTRTPKQKLLCKTWTDALREVVRCCYRHHGLEHLLELSAYDAGGAGADPKRGQRQRSDMWQQLSPPVESEAFPQVEDHLLGEAVSGHSSGAGSGGGGSGEIELPSPVCPEEAPPTVTADKRAPTLFVPTTILLDLKLRPTIAAFSPSMS